MREWLPGWKARGWKRKGGVIENLDLWKVLDRDSARHEVNWEWVRGHAGHPRNEYVNFLAIRAAEQQDSSEGFMGSGVEEWLDRERAARGRYHDLDETSPPTGR
jgi:ribonuclease HI